MTQENFNELVEARLQKVKATLIEKGKEYARNNNPLHNFEVGYKLTGEHPAKVLDGFLLKHYISYRDMLADIQAAGDISPEKIREKFGDIITYFVIQEIIFLEWALAME